MANLEIFSEPFLSAFFAISGLEHRYIRQTIKMELAVTNKMGSLCYQYEVWVWTK